MNCPHCQATLPDQTYYCKHCRRNIDPALVPPPLGPYYCANCGHWGKPKTHTRGSFLIELLLWLCFILPGVVYSLWRLSSRYKACPACHAPNMLPASSPKAQAAAQS